MRGAAGRGRGPRAPHRHRLLRHRPPPRRGAGRPQAPHSHMQGHCGTGLAHQACDDGWRADWCPPCWGRGPPRARCRTRGAPPCTTSPSASQRRPPPPPGRLNTPNQQITNRTDESFTVVSTPLPGWCWRPGRTSRWTCRTGTGSPRS